jgi:hypothetical protein
MNEIDVKFVYTHEDVADTINVMIGKGGYILNRDSVLYVLKRQYLTHGLEWPYRAKDKISRERINKSEVEAYRLFPELLDKKETLKELFGGE